MARDGATAATASLPTSGNGAAAMADRRERLRTSRELSAAAAMESATGGSWLAAREGEGRCVDAWGPRHAWCVAWSGALAGKEALFRCGEHLSGEPAIRCRLEQSSRTLTHTHQRAAQSAFRPSRRPGCDDCGRPRPGRAYHWLSGIRPDTVEPLAAWAPCERSAEWGRAPGRRRSPHARHVLACASAEPATRARRLSRSSEERRALRSYTSLWTRCVDHSRLPTCRLQVAPPRQARSWQLRSNLSCVLLLALPGQTSCGRACGEQHVEWRQCC